MKAMHEHDQMDPLLLFRVEDFISHDAFICYFKNSTPLQTCQLNISISNSRQEVDDFVEELTF